MNHEELLKVIDEVGYCVENGHTLLRTEITDLTKALRAVVELHKPFNFETGPDEYVSVCKHCQLGAVGDTYPCETINAIQEHLK